MTALLDRINGYTGGVAIKIPCHCATVSNITLSGLQVIDGIQTTENMRVLVKDNEDLTENGIWLAQTSSWVRAPDFNGNRDAVNGTFVKVVYGNTNARTLFNLVTQNPITIGTSNIVFEVETYSAVQALVDEAIAARDAALAAAALLPLNNYTATTDPTVNDDVTDGYSAGSQWINTNTGDRFSCTSAAAGAAIWTPISADLSALGNMAYEDKADYVLYLNVPEIKSIIQNSQSSAYTLVLGDAGKHIYHPPADTTARTWNIPRNIDVAYPIGTAITFDNDIGAGAITIALDTTDGDVLVLVGTAGGTGNRTLASGGQATALKVGAKRWRISGTGLT